MTYRNTMILTTNIFIGIENLLSRIERWLHNNKVMNTCLWLYTIKTCYQIIFIDTLQLHTNRLTIEIDHFYIHCTNLLNQSTAGRQGQNAQTHDQSSHVNILVKTLLLKNLYVRSWGSHTLFNCQNSLDMDGKSCHCLQPFNNLHTPNYGQ